MSKNLNIYFCGSISGWRDDREEYAQLIEYIENIWHNVLTKHVWYKNPYSRWLSSKEIFEKDYDWLRESNVVIAEISTLSHGVGVEIWLAITNEKPILTLRKEWKWISPMIEWAPNSHHKIYKNIEEVKKQVYEFLSFNF